jgi:hypothetical protein
MFSSLWSPEAACLFVRRFETLLQQCTRLFDPVRIITGHHCSSPGTSCSLLRVACIYLLINTLECGKHFESERPKTLVNVSLEPLVAFDVVVFEIKTLIVRKPSQRLALGGFACAGFAA